MPDFLRSLLDWFRARSQTQMTLIASAVIILLVLISRVLFVIAGIVFLATLCGMIVQLVREQPARLWVAATGISFAVALLFGFVAVTIYDPMTTVQVSGETVVIILTGIVAVGGMVTGWAAHRQASAAQKQVSITAQSLSATEQSLREQNERARLHLETDMVFRLEERFNSGRLLVARRNAAQHIKVKFLKGKDTDTLDELGAEDLTPEFQPILNFFEYLAHLTNRRVLHVESVWEKFARWIEGYWTLYEPAIQQYRTVPEYRHVFSDFEKLKCRMIELDLKDKGVREINDKSDLRFFVATESALQDQQIVT